MDRGAKWRSTMWVFCTQDLDHALTFWMRPVHYNHRLVINIGKFPGVPTKPPVPPRYQETSPEVAANEDRYAGSAG